MVFAVVGGLTFLKRQRFVNVLGINISASPEKGSLRKCKVRGSAAIWKKGTEKQLIPLGEDFSYGDAFVADLSGDQGRVIRLKSPGGDNYGMHGTRLWSFAFGDGLGQVARNQGTNHTTVILVGLAVVGVILLGVLGLVYKVFTLMQEQGAV